jgi:hypothetical protein
MPKLKNVSPRGALDVPLLRRVIDAGETVDVTEDQARVLLLQPANYEPADKTTKALAADLAASQDPHAADGRDGHEQDAHAPAGGAGKDGSK